MRSFAEFHDSQVATISNQDEMVVLAMPHVYIYQFDAKPFSQPGRGCSQVGQLIFYRVDSVEIPDCFSDPDEAPFDIWGGDIWIDDSNVNGIFEIPFSVQSAKIRAEITFNNGSTFKIACGGVTFQAQGAPEFIEDYRL